VYHFLDYTEKERNKNPKSHYQGSSASLSNILNSKTVIQNNTTVLRNQFQNLLFFQHTQKSVTSGSVFSCLSLVFILFNPSTT